MLFCGRQNCICETEVLSTLSRLCVDFQTRQLLEETKPTFSVTSGAAAYEHLILMYDKGGKVHSVQRTENCAVHGMKSVCSSWDQPSLLCPSQSYPGREMLLAFLPVLAKMRNSGNIQKPDIDLFMKKYYYTLK